MAFDKLFDGTILYGVYRITQAEKLSDLKALCLENDFSFFILDGTNVHDEDDFMRHYKTVLQPDEYSENWNSILSSLRTTQWLATKGVVVAYDNFQNFMIGQPEGFELAVQVFGYAVDFRNEKRDHPLVKPLYILLRGDDGGALRMALL
jgi:hypothetical protein